MLVTENGLGFFIRENKLGDMAVIEEVVRGDCYGLKALAESGYSPSHIIDIGAHIGCFTVLAHKFFPKTWITAFEPNNESFKLLAQNTSHIPHIEIINAAVHSGSDLVYMDSNDATGGGFVATKEKANRMAELKNDADHFYYYESNEKVRTVDLADYLTQKNTFLKIDCEGSEHDIFEHLSIEKANLVSRIAGEYHLMNDDRCDTWGEFKELCERTFPNLQFEPRLVALCELFYGKPKSV